MSDPPSWKWLGRAADLAQLTPVLIALALVVTAAVKGDDIAGAVGGATALLSIVAVVAVVGLALIVSSVVRRRGFARTFQSDRGRVDSAVLIAGCVLTGAALLLLLLLF